MIDDLLGMYDETIFPYGSVTPTEPPSYDFLSDTEVSPIARQILHPSYIPPTTHTTDLTPPSNHNLPMEDSLPTPPPPPTHHMHTCSKSGIFKPTHRLNLHSSSISSVPRSHLQALKDPNWQKAMHEEYNGLISNGTWVLVSRPTGTNMIRLCGYSSKSSMKMDLSRAIKLV